VSKRSARSWREISSRFLETSICGRRAPELPIDVAPRIGKARIVVDQRHSAVQTVVKCESIILMSRGELVWMGFENLMLIFCWVAVSMFYSILCLPLPKSCPVSALLWKCSAVSRPSANHPDTHNDYAYRKSVIAMQKKK
jgi:hypothetical protein